MAELRLGTSSWTAKGWEQVFYPEGTKPSDYIAHYATRFNTVEIDATFYAIPSAAAINNWVSKTPEDFLFAAKVPQVVTHEKLLHDCADDMNAFLRAIAGLGDRLGPLLLQFQYFSKKTGVKPQDFMPRLEAFLDTLPRGEFRFAVEIRNKTWLTKAFIEMLGERKVCLALIDHPWMALPHELFAKRGIITSDFLYLRWLGDRRKIEMKLKAKNNELVWKENIEDRNEHLANWTPHIKQALDIPVDVYGYVNNHYSGYAPNDVETLLRLLS